VVAFGCTEAKTGAASLLLELVVVGDAFAVTVVVVEIVGVVVVVEVVVEIVELAVEVVVALAKVFEELASSGDFLSVLVESDIGLMAPCVADKLRTGFFGKGGFKVPARLVCCRFNCAKADSGLHLLHTRSAFAPRTITFDEQQSAHRNSPHFRQ